MTRRTICAIGPLVASGIAIIAVNAALLHGQDAADGMRPSFEVVSIKPNHSGWGGMSTDHPPFGPHYSAINVTAKWLIQSAYRLKDFQISGLPGWCESQRYDVEADVDEATPMQMRKLSRNDQIDKFDLMMQSLLADRFRLKVTHATKELPILALVIAKDDSKLKALAVDPYPANRDGGMIIGKRGNGSGQVSVQANRATLQTFANGLTIALGKQVNDETGLKGNYSFSIRWTDEVPTAAQTLPDPAYDRTLVAALQEDGLKLESTKGPLETIVIEHIEQPSPN
jgi:uncharacterized protein (TIGR03435 family)